VLLEVAQLAADMIAAFWTQINRHLFGPFGSLKNMAESPLKHRLLSDKLSIASTLCPPWLSNLNPP
jgi:hypothetical protein